MGFCLITEKVLDVAWFELNVGACVVTWRVVPPPRGVDLSEKRVQPCCSCLILTAKTGFICSSFVPR